MRYCSLLSAIIVCLCMLAAPQASANAKGKSALEKAEAVIMSKPDSTLSVLEGIDTCALRTADIHRWHLLHVWAQYNCYSNNISLDELLRSTDYILSHRAGHRLRAQAYFVRAAVREEMRDGSNQDWVDDFSRGCKEVEKTGDAQLAALLFQRHGAAMSRHQWYDAACESYIKSVDYARKSGNTTYEITALINLSYSYCFAPEPDYQAAESYASQACGIAKSKNNENDYSKALLSLSNALTRQGKYEQALQAARESISISERMFESGRRKERVRYSVLADAFRHCEMADSALFYAEKDFDHPSIVTRRSAYQVTYLTYREILHDDEMTVKYMTIYSQLNDQQKKEFESEKVTRKQMDLEEEISASQRRKITVTALAAVLFLCSILAFSIIIYRKRIHSKEEEVRAKELEAQEKARDASRAMDEAGRVTSVLIDEDPLIAGLRQKPRYLSEKEWDAVIDKTDRVYNGWCRKLSQENPGLTQVNIRLLTLVKLRYSNPQIALMMGISPASVVKAKQRLKGKVS